MIHEPALKSQSESNDTWSALRVPIWIKWFVIYAPKSRSESYDSRSLLWNSNLKQMICVRLSKVPIRIKRFTNTHRSPDLNQMIRNPHSKVPIWIKNPLRSSDLNQWFVSPLRSPDLNQMIRNPHSKVPIWITNPLRSSDLNQWFVNPLRSPDLNDSWTCMKVPIWIKWYVIRTPCPDLNQMICDICSEVPIWIIWFAIHTPKFRSESKIRSEVPI